MGMFNNGADRLGCFVHRETKHTFEYRPTENQWALERNLGFEIAIGYGNEVRYADIRATVAFVAIDEGPHNNAILERWPIRRIA